MSDLINRQAAIDALADMHCKSDEDGYIWIIRSDAWARIDALPSVTPKQERGKWIDGKVKHIENGELRNVRECSECGSSYFVYDNYNNVDEIPNYCPNCGARMTEEDV